MSDAPPPPADPFSEPPKPPTVPVLRPLSAVPTSNPVPPPPDAPGLPDAVTPPEVIVAPDAPKRRRGLIAGLAAMVAGVAAIGGVLVFRSGGADAYSLTKATSAAAAADKVAFTMHMEMAGESLDMDARVDGAAKLMAMTAAVPGLTDGASVGIVLDLAAKRMYMDASAIPGAEGVPTKWILFDMSQMEGAESSLGAFTDSSPLTAASILDGAKDVKDLGIEDLDGEKVKHYVATVSLDDLKKAQPGLFEQLGAGAIDLPATVDYDVWVTKDNLMRKMGFSMPVAGEFVAVEMVVTAVGDIDPIAVPADADVTDMSELLGSGG